MLKTELYSVQSCTLATGQRVRNAVHGAGGGGEVTLNLPLPFPQQLGFKMLRPYITD